MYLNYRILRILINLRGIISLHYNTVFYFSLIRRKSIELNSTILDFLV
jgi:hypothetical protein